MVEKRDLESYQTEDGDTPFDEWFDSIRDQITKHRIDARLTRLRAGNYGDYRMLAGGMGELKLAFGPGYRIYFGEVGKRLVILLCAGDKGSQSSDIKLARAYWDDYRRRHG